MPAESSDYGWTLVERKTHLPVLRSMWCAGREGTIGAQTDTRQCMVHLRDMAFPWPIFAGLARDANIGSGAAHSAYSASETVSPVGQGTPTPFMYLPDRLPDHHRVRLGISEVRQL